MIYFLGDLHFSTSHEWDVDAITKFISWFKEQQFEPGSTLIQLGDVFDRASNYGETIKLVTEFFKIASEKFEKVYVLGGNHDLGISKQRYQYATFFLPDSFENIECIYEEKIINFNGTSIAFLPFRKIKGKILEDYYSKELDESFYKADIVCGHVALKEEKSFFGGILPDKFSGKFIMGHIHTRVGNYKDSYTGSIMPFKINENQTELQRAIIGYNVQSKIFSEISIPDIISFEQITFGDEINQNKDGLVHLYTIKNCKHLQEAKSVYSNYYVYNIEKPKVENENVSVSEQTILLTPIDALSLMIKEQKIIPKRNTVKLVKELLSA
jgi:DNA repair exonuclease SbcCD nuclease subunit